MSESNVMYSGGARGADLLWGEIASKEGHHVIHFVFKGHGTKAPKEQQEMLSDEELIRADKHLIEANKVLKRTFPTTNDYTNNLLRRNVYQVFFTQSLYAVAGIDFDTGNLMGGTAWATQVFKNAWGGVWDSSRENGNGGCYCFNVNDNHWYSWDYHNLKWKEIERPPTPSGNWTGIGTSRYLTDEAKQAMKNLFENERKD